MQCLERHRPGTGSSQTPAFSPRPDTRNSNTTVPNPHGYRPSASSPTCSHNQLPPWLSQLKYTMGWHKLKIGSSIKAGDVLEHMSMGSTSVLPRLSCFVRVIIWFLSRSVLGKYWHHWSFWKCHKTDSRLHIRIWYCTKLNNHIFVIIHADAWDYLPQASDFNVYLSFILKVIPLFAPGACAN